MSVVLSEHLPLLASAPDGIQKLRGLILELAVRGKLVPQNPDDEPASELLKRITKERARQEAEKICKKSKSLPPVSEDEKPFALPHAWAWTRLGEITNFGQTDKDGEISDTTWVLDLEDIQKDTSVLLQKIRFSERQAKSDKNRFQEGDVLYGKLRPYLNKVIVADEGGVCTTEILPVRGYLGIFPRYLMYAVKRPDFLAYVNAQSYGMKMPRLGTDDGRLALFPLAPEKEQLRIVAKVDELMALCDRLEAEQADAASAHARLVETLLGTLTQSADAADLAANWQRLAGHFDTLFATEASIDALKQTVLQLAVMGKLVPQNPADEPASELLKRIAAEKDRLSRVEGLRTTAEPHIEADEQYMAIPDSWRFQRLGNLAKFIDYRGKTPDKINSGVPLITAKNVRFGFISREPYEFVSEKEYTDWMTRGFPRLGDILFTTEAPLGNAAIVDISEKFALAQRVICFQFHEPQIANYLLLALMSKQVRHQIEGEATGMTATGIKASRLKEIPVPIPPLAEQHRIVTKVNELMTLCDRLIADLGTAHQRQATLADTLIESALEAA